MARAALDLASRTLPFPHQVEATEFILRKGNVAIFDEQGLGKTKIVLDAILAELANGRVDGALIVCKAGLISTWQAEIQKHTNTSAAVLAGNSRRAGRSYMVHSPFQIVAYSLVGRELPNLRSLLRIRRTVVVLDESHTIKNPKAKVTLDALALGELASQRLILTGTPVANYPEDLWAQFLFLDRGETLGKDYEAFRQVYHLGSGTDRREVGLPQLNSIAEAIRPSSIRRTKDGVLDLPEKRYRTISVRLVGAQAKAYRGIQEELRLEIDRERRDGVKVEIDNILERLLRLVQVASNPGLIYPRWQVDPAKFKLLDEELDAVDGRSEKAILWTQFVQNVEALRIRYKARGAVAIHGGVSIDRRAELVERFQKSRDCRILVAVPAAAREGLTLTAANNAYYVDRSFNLVDYLQSQDRIHRIGQERTSTISKLVAAGTVDEFVETILSRKAEIATSIQNGISRRPVSPIFSNKELERVLT